MEKLKNVTIRHLKMILQEDFNYTVLMKDVFAYKGKRGFWDIKGIKLFKDTFLKSVELSNEIKQMNILSLSPIENPSLKAPKNIDNIPYVARLELESFINNASNDDVISLMAEVVVKVCFKEHTGNIYDSDSLGYKEFQKVVENTSFVEVVGLYNWISKELDESNKKWNNNFQQVYVPDEDYEAVGGSSIMKKFNVINNIKMVCKNLNVTDDEAWQKSYSYVQMLSLESASSAFIQDKMRERKEQKMRMNRNK